MGFLEDRFAAYPDASSKDLAKVLGVSMPTVYTWLKQGKIPAYDLEGKWLILNQETLHWVRARVNTATQIGTDTAPET